MEEESIILLAQEQERRTVPILQKLSQTVDLLSIQHKRTNRSLRLLIDLTKAHNDVPFGLEDLDRIFLWLTIEKADSNFTYKLKQTNQQKSGTLTGVQGASLDQHEFTEILITNTAAVGEAIIQVGWRE